MIDNKLVKQAQLSKEDIDDVNTFYNNIVLPTKLEFGGVPGKDYDPKYYIKNFPKKVSIEYYSGKPTDNFGYVSPADASSIVHLSKDFGGQSAFVHELAHLQNRDAPYYLRPDIPLVKWFSPTPHSGASY